MSSGILLVDPKQRKADTDSIATLLLGHKSADLFFTFQMFIKL